MRSFARPLWMPQLNGDQPAATCDCREGAEMKNSEVVQEDTKLQPTRRALLQGAAAVTAAAVLAPSVSKADSHEAESQRYTSDRPVASISKNVVETDSGKVAGYESGGI